MEATGALAAREALEGLAATAVQERMTQALAGEAATEEKAAMAVAVAAEPGAQATALQRTLPAS